MIRRREFITLVGGAAAVWPFVAQGQQSALPIIGFLSGGSAASWAPLVAAFRDGLRETGYIEGNNIAFDFRWAEGRYERLPAMATDLVRRQVSVLVTTGGPPAVRAAMSVTKKIPIVFTLGADPIEQGFVGSLSRPGANITGVTLFTRDLIPKRLELLEELVPKAKKIAVLLNPKNPATEIYNKEIQLAARALARDVDVVTASSKSDIDDAFEALVRHRAAALLIVSDPLFEIERVQIIALATRYAIPTIYSWREDVMSGGLMSYGPSIRDTYRQAGLYAGRILKGAKPADLPVQQPTKFELIVNMKVANDLGLSVPPSLLARADEVIE